MKTIKLLPYLFLIALLSLNTLFAQVSVTTTSSSPVFPGTYDHPARIISADSHGDNIPLEESDSGSFVILSNHQTFSISLLDNADNTGYEWSYSISTPNIIQLQDWITFSHLSKSEDLSKTRIWIFKKMESGDTLVTLTYKKPWEDTPLKNIQFSIKCE
ncbi:MAG: hypothetical protein A3F67_05870 [Verrucomicrobia bacterium RIFCSPHIGHO2_12_FULL_41_10]|nr:MAG: hypothetical protein A3F67_05870 [Verrucomicrobia bacterium RIFCSPHIGHO2_12_FULL_41_10]HLB33437.1 protease inhibitor I42 family protein [Chthoniobacterales bacterium]